MLNDGDKFERNGRWFRLTTEVDEDHGAPWLNEDGHGIITRRRHVRHNSGMHIGKRASERVLMDHGVGETSFYDFAATVKLAHNDRWGYRGLSVEEQMKDGMSRKAVAAAAAEADFKRMKAWADDEWHYVGVIVTLLDTDNETPRPLYRESLWGIESDSDKYIEETAYELADQIIARMGE